MLQTYLRFLLSNKFTRVDAALHAFMASLGFRLVHNHMCSRIGNISSQDMTLWVKGTVVKAVIAVHDPVIKSDKAFLINILVNSIFYSVFNYFFILLFNFYLKLDASPGRVKIVNIVCVQNLYNS